MPGVRKLDALPKPMQALVEAMKLQNILTGDELVTKEHLDRAPAELRKKCYSNLSYQLKAHFPDKATAYTLLTTPEENAEWLAAFINDPPILAGALTLLRTRSDVKSNRLMTPLRCG